MADNTTEFLDSEKLNERTRKTEASLSFAEGPTPGPSKSTVVFEDYIYYAEEQREYEKIVDGRAPRVATRLQQSLRYRGRERSVVSTNPDDDVQIHGLDSVQSDKIHAWRALRQASWAQAFYLSTTDILGPFNAPYAFRQNGYVPGTLLFVFMGGVAFYCGALLWWLYVKLDSDRFPVKSYSDITERVAGKPLRLFVTWLVFIHMIVNVGTTSLSSAQSLYQVAHGHICFVVAIVIWILVGMCLNQIRTLSRYGWIASLAIWLNLLVLFLSVGFIAHSAPNYAAAKAAYGVSEGPVLRTAFANYPFFERINGVMNIVYSYGGATIFPQIIAEMRRPMDYLKAFSIAQALIFSVYVFYGLYVYSFQGQFTLPVAYQGVSHYSWQTIGNVLSLISGMIAGGLYGNIGLKIFYVNIIEDMFKGPPLLTVKGRWTWTGFVFIFWAVGFIIAASIPQVQTLSGMVGAVTNMQFTYSFPTGFTFLYLVQLHATASDAPYKPGSLDRADSWTSLCRWKRGFMGGSWPAFIFKWCNFVLCLAALATAGLGIYGSGLSIRNAFRTAAATSLGALLLCERCYRLGIW